MLCIDNADVCVYVACEHACVDVCACLFVDVYVCVQFRFPFSAICIGLVVKKEVSERGGVRGERSKGEESEGGKEREGGGGVEVLKDMFMNLSFSQWWAWSTTSFWISCTLPERVMEPR